MIGNVSYERTENARVHTARVVRPLRSIRISFEVA
jgi:hypothetical protein